MDTREGRLGETPRPTELHTPATGPAPGAWLVGGFLIGGLTWGVLARAWMRLVSPDPEFSWSGTLFIVAVFTVAGTAQGIARVVRLRRWRRWAQTIIRFIAAFLVLPLAGGAGVVMLPAMLTGSLALARTDWRRRWRLALGLVAAANVAAMFPMLKESLPWTRTVVGWSLMVPLYTVIVWAASLNLRPLGDGWSMTGRAKVGGLVLLAASVGAVCFMAVIGA